MFKHRLYDWLEIKPRAAFIAVALWTCGCAASLAGLSGPSIVGLVLLGLAVAALCAWVQRKRLGVAFVCSLCLGVAYTSFRLHNNAAESEHLFDKWAHVVAVAEQCETPGDGKRARLWLRIEEFEHKPLPTKLLVMANSFAGAMPTELIRSNDSEQRVVIASDIKIRRPSPAAFPWDFDEARYLQRRGAIGVAVVSKRQRMRVVAHERVGQAERIGAVTDVIRRRMVALHRVVLGEESGDLLSSMVIGDKAVRPSQKIQEQFQALGLTHIIAASGFNLTIVTAVAWWSLRLFCRSALINTVWCLLSIGFFCMLAGFSASVERAALMCSFLLLASLCRRSAHLPAVIGLALFVTTLLDPVALLDVGLQLSYCATLCIALCATRITRWLSGGARVPAAIAEIVAAVALANASVLPLQMMYFWQVGELSLPANVAVSPFVPPITVLGFVSSTLAALGVLQLSVVCVGIDWLLKLPIWMMLSIVESFAANRWSVLSIGPPLGACVWFYYLSLCALVASVCTAADNVLRKALIAGALVLYLVAAAALFVRLPLESPTIICARSAMLIIVPGTQAFWLGSADDVSIQRAGKYFGINQYVFIAREMDRAPMGIPEDQRANSRSSQTSVFQWKPNGVKRVRKVDELWF